MVPLLALSGPSLNDAWDLHQELKRSFPVHSLLESVYRPDLPAELKHAWQCNVWLNDTLGGKVLIFSSTVAWPVWKGRTEGFAALRCVVDAWSSLEKFFPLD